MDARIFLFRETDLKNKRSTSSFIEKYIPFLEENVPRNCFKSRDFLHEKGTSCLNHYSTTLRKKHDVLVRDQKPKVAGNRNSFRKESGATNQLRTRRNQPLPLKINPPNPSRKITCTTWKLLLQNRTYPNLLRNRYKRTNKFGIFLLFSYSQYPIVFFINFDHYLRSNN